MTHSSWIDTVWSSGEAGALVFGCVRAVEGEDLTLSIIGPMDRGTHGAEILPSTGKRRCARLPVAALLRNWTLVDGVAASAFRGHARSSTAATG